MKGGNKTNARVHHASPRTPSSHSSLETHPTALQWGQDTSTCGCSILSSSPHPATRSALTKQAGWKVCEQTLVPITKLFARGRIDTCFIDEPDTSGNGSSSDGPTPQLVSQHRKPTSRSRSSTRLRRVGPGAGGGVHCFFSRGCDGRGARWGPGWGNGGAKLKGGGCCCCCCCCCAVGGGAPAPGGASLGPSPPNI